MNIFIDREKEIKQLCKLYEKRHAVMAIVYGRRRLGKTFLLKHFVKDRPHYYVCFVRVNNLNGVKETLVTSAPLYGRSPLRLSISPLDYAHIPVFIPHVNNTAGLVEFYSLAGGTPRYLELVRNYPSFKNALREFILDKNGLFYNEAKYILQEEMTSPNVYWSILNAIASEKQKYNANIRDSLVKRRNAIWYYKS